MGQRMKVITVSMIALICLSGAAAAETGLYELIRRKSVPVRDCSDAAAFVNAMPDARLVLLGESTHGTSQYYRFRGEISKKLIAERDHSFIAVEGDWASIYRLNLYVKGIDRASGSAREILKSFDRWPEWMWANEDVAELAEWLKKHNDGLPPEKKAGIYGMDVYGPWEAMDGLLEYAKKNLPSRYAEIKDRTESFSGFGRDEMNYVRWLAGGGPSAEGRLREITGILEENRERLVNACPDGYLNALQNSLVLLAAEEFFRLSLQRGPASWNGRVMHMNGTVNRLLDHYGSDSKGIVWAHNTHVGDSRATEMRGAGMVNIGKLSRIEHGSGNVFIVGFSTFTGTVLAGSSWGGPFSRMEVPEAAENSIDRRLKNARGGNYFLLFDEEARNNEEFMAPAGHRAIGVVYDPSRERGNYVLTILPARYDAIVFFRSTNALVPVR